MHLVVIMHQETYLEENCKLEAHLEHGVVVHVRFLWGK